MKLAILGFAREGKSVLKFLRKSRLFQNAEIVICDRDTNISRFHRGLSTKSERIHANDTNIKCRLGKAYLDNLDQFDIVFRSPGVPYNLPQIQKALKKGVKFSSATKLFFSAIGGSASGGENAQGNIIGVTGTKGKGTTSTLLYEILKNCGLPVVLAGNIGKAALDILPKLKENTWVVLELSSFQLQDLKQSPKIAVVLDIFPDHLDSHKNFKEYAGAKANIGRFQTKKDRIFYFADSKRSVWIANQSPAQKIAVESGSVNIPPLKILGEHNRKNAAMAKTVALALGCPEHAIDRIIADYEGMEHRLELVRIMRTRGSTQIKTRINADIISANQRVNPRKSAIHWYNDSASTNPQTAAAAVLAFASSVTSQAPNQTVLIAGGKDKNLDYKPLARAIKKAGNIGQVVLFGENKKKIQKALSGIRNYELRIMTVSDLKTAVINAHKIAASLIHDSRFVIHVVFSPGAASFDMFKDYQDRGEQFKKIVKSLKRK